MTLSKSERGIFEPVKSEEMIVREIVDLLTLNGVTVYRIAERIPRRDQFGRVRGRISEPGIPDLQGFAIGGSEGEGQTRYAIPFWCEVKAQKGQLRPAQRQFLEAYQAVGLFAFVARSWQDVKDSFTARGIRLKVG